MNAATYTATATDHRFHNVLLCRVDSRRGACGYVHRYAAISIEHACGYDPSTAFWDSWDEVRLSER